MELSGRIETDAQENFSTAAALAEWPKRYYEEKNPAVRLELLEAAIAAGVDPETDAIRRRIFDMRYEPNKHADGGYADRFMRCFMNFSMLTKEQPGRFGMKKARKSVMRDLEVLGLTGDAEGSANENAGSAGTYAKRDAELGGSPVCSGDIPTYLDMYDAALLDEYRHLGQLFIAMSADSKQYNALILGIGKINKDTLVEKLHRDLASAGKDVADLFDLHDEMQLWMQGLDDARARMLPQTKPLM